MRSTILFVAISLLTLGLVAQATAVDDALPGPVVNGDFELYVETTGSDGAFDGPLWWTSGTSSYSTDTTYEDNDGDDDREAIIAADPSTGNHNMWQSVQLPARAYTLNFDAFEWTLESGTIAPSANNQIGFQISPSYIQHPFLGRFWEGAVLFRANDMAETMDDDGRVHLDPAVHGEITCPNVDADGDGARDDPYPPCVSFRADFDAADEDGKRALLGQARIAQTSFWNFNRQTLGDTTAEGDEVAPAVIDDVAYVGVTTIAEELAQGNVNPNPGT